MCDSAHLAGRWRGWTAALAVGLSACGSGSPSPAACRDAVRDNLQAQGLVVDTVRCSAVSGDDADVTCRAQVGATELSMRVGIDGDALRVRPLQPTVLVAKIEPQVRAKLTEAGVGVRSLSCEGAVWVARNGGQGRCSAIDETGQAWTYEATFRGEGSHHTARIARVVEGRADDRPE